MSVTSNFVEPLDDVDSSVGIGLEDCATSFRHAGEGRRGIVACFLDTIYRPQPFSVPQGKRFRYLENLLAPIDSILPPSAPSPLEISSSIYAHTTPLVGAWEKEIFLFSDDVHQILPNIDVTGGDAEETLGVYYGQPGDANLRSEPTPQARPLSTLVWRLQPDEDISVNANRYHKPSGGDSVSIIWNLHLTPGKVDSETCKIRPQVLCAQDLAPKLRPPSTIAKFLASYLYILPPELRGTGAIHTYGYATLCSTKASDVIACPAWDPALTHAPGQLDLPLEPPQPSRGIAGAGCIAYQLDQQDGADGESGDDEADWKPAAKPYKPNSYTPYTSAGSSECSGPPPSTARSQNDLTSSNTSMSDGQLPRVYRQFLGTTGSGDEDDEQEDHVKQPSKSNILDEELVPRLACPYYKYNVNKYRNVRCCCGPGWRTVHRLKGHLFDRHSHNRRCNRCQQTFKSGAKFSQHQRSNPPCLARNCVEDLMTDRQEELVKRRMQAAKFPNEEDKWREIYRILHQPDDLSQIPSPYYDSHPTSVNTTGSGFASFLDSLTDSHSEVGLRARGSLNLLIGEYLPNTEKQELEAIRERFVNTFREIANFWKESQRQSMPVSQAQNQRLLPPQALEPQPQEDYLDPRVLENLTTFSQQYPVPFPFSQSVTNVHTHIINPDPIPAIFPNAFNYAADPRFHIDGLPPALGHLGVASPGSVGPQSFEILSDTTSSPPPSNAASLQVPNSGDWEGSWLTSTFAAPRQPGQRRMASEDETDG